MRAALTLAAALLTAAPVAAVAAPFALDRSHSYVGFSISHLGYSDTHGHFDDYAAEIDFDPTAPGNSSVSFTIQTASIDTDWDPRDEHLRSADFFNVASHPTITFVSTGIEMVGDNAAKLTGDLTLMGQTRQETLDVTLNNMGRSPLTQRPTAGFNISGQIDRTKYGLSTYAPAIGAMVDIYVSLEITPAR